MAIREEFDGMTGAYRGGHCINRSDPYAYDLVRAAKSLQNHRGCDTSVVGLVLKPTRGV